MKTFLFSAFILFAGHVPGFAADNDPLRVVTTILPYKEFIEAVGGPRVQVSVLVPPGANPHVYELTPGQLKQLSKADLYVKTGTSIEFELTWMDKMLALNRSMRVCNSAEDISLLDMGDQHEGHAGKDPHVWLSPKNVMTVVENIKNALVQLDPIHASEYTGNAETYKESLLLLDKEIRRKLADLPVRAFIDFHPDWGYFAREYGLTQIAIESEGKEPSAGHLASIVRLAKKRGIKTVFVSPQVNPKSAGIIAGEIGGKVVTVDPLSENYIRSLRETATALLKNNE